MDEIIGKGPFIVLGKLAHLCEVDLIVIFEAIEDMLKVFGVAGHIKSHCDDGNQMMDLRFLEFL